MSPQVPIPAAVWLTSSEVNVCSLGCREIARHLRETNDVVNMVVRNVLLYGGCRSYSYCWFSDIEALSVSLDAQRCSSLIDPCAPTPLLHILVYMD